MVGSRGGATAARSGGRVGPVAGLIVIVTVSLVDGAPSVVLRSRMCWPAAEKVAVVVWALALPSATVPGPLILD